MEKQSKAQQFLEHLRYLSEGLVGDSDHLHLRADHRKGVRCLNCGRLLPHVHTLPAVRTCPNEECRTKYHLTRSERRGIGISEI
jgi:hypothetical protein